MTIKQFNVDAQSGNVTALTMHEMRKLKNPNFLAEKAAYMAIYWLKNKEKLRAYNIERFAKIKAKKIADEQELTTLRNLND